MYKSIDMISRSIKSYNGLNGYRKTKNGFIVAVNVSDEILDLTAKNGYRQKEVLVSVSKDKVEFCRYSSDVFKKDKDIVGISYLVNSAKMFLKRNNLRYVNIRLEVLEIKSRVKEYIQVAEYEWSK